MRDLLPRLFAKSRVNAGIVKTPKEALDAVCNTEWLALVCPDSFVNAIAPQNTTVEE
jgi:hypothetical protein